MPQTRRLTLSDVTVTLDALPEDTRPEEHFDFPADVEWVKARWDSNPWAWFIAKVTVEFNGFTASDYLGGCAYESERDFRTDPYFADMVTEALERLNAEIAAIDARIPHREAAELG